jgi:hypothetical protein
VNRNVHRDETNLQLIYALNTKGTVPKAHGP